MIYDGFDFSPWLRVNMTRPIAPPVEVETEAAAGRDGTAFRSARLGELSIPVTVRLDAPRGTDMAELRHMLASKLVSKEPRPLVLPDDPTRYHMALLSGASDLDTLWRTGRAELEFLAPDPVAYGVTRKVNIMPGGSVFVEGNMPTYPVIEGSGGGAGAYSVILVGTGEKVELDCEVGADDVVTIDCAAQHCEINGEDADPHVTLDSDFFALMPGDNRLNITGADVVCSWTERWL